jgi:hypothetical protein
MAVRRMTAIADEIALPNAPVSATCSPRARWIDVNTSTDTASTLPGSRIIAVLEAAWTEIQRRHPDVPAVVVITGTGRESRGYATLGHFGAERWRTGEDDRLPELFIAGELLAGSDGRSGGRAVLKTLLHEAAHGVAFTRRVKDCSRQNRYHNRRFARLAVELGLTPPDEPHPTIGWSGATLDDEGAAAWAGTIELIDAARLPHLGELFTAPPLASSIRAGGRIRVACVCDPPRSLSITPKQFETAPLICGACREFFDPH